MPGRNGLAVALTRQRGVAYLMDPGLHPIRRLVWRHQQQCAVSGLRETFAQLLIGSAVEAAVQLAIAKPEGLLGRRASARHWRRAGSGNECGPEPIAQHIVAQRTQRRQVHTRKTGRPDGRVQTASAVLAPVLPPQVKPPASALTECAGCPEGLNSG